MEGYGRALVVAGAVLLASGALLSSGIRAPFLGRLPGDLAFGSGNARVSVPVTTCLVLSVVLTALMRIFGNPR